MKKQKIFLRILTIALFLLFLFLLGRFAFVFAQDKGQLSDVELEESYIIDSVLDIPQATISVNGKTNDAKSSVIFPSGLCTVKTKINLSEAGEYIVRYYSVINGKSFSFDKSFIVYDNAYNVSTKLSNSVYDEEKGGIVVNLSNGAVFNYNRVIDLSDNTKLDSLFECYVLASKDGVVDFGKFYIVLTDCENPDNYIRIRIHSAQVEFSSYRSANPNVEYTSYVGATVGNNSVFVALAEEGEKTYIYKENDRFGRAIRFSFINRGFSGNGDYNPPGCCVNPKDDRCLFSFDYANKKLYCTSSVNPLYNTALSDGLVCDFDDTVYFDNEWKGFSNGKCKLSIYAANYFSDNACIVVTEIDGHDLSEDYLLDNDAPEIDVDFGNYNINNIPQGIIGCKYNIFDYKCFDAYGISTSSCNVFYNYYSDNRINIDIENGCFIPQKKGYYHIEYLAKDINGNTNKYAVPVYVDSEIEDLTCSVMDLPSSTAGSVYNLPSSVISSNGNYGEVKQKILAIKGDYSEEIDGLSFIPMYVGKWTIKYQVENFSGQKTVCEKTLDIANPNKPVFIDNVFSDFPKYFLENKEYVLPLLYAYTFNDNGYTQNQALIKYSYGDNYQTSEGLRFVPQSVNNAKSVSLYYEYEGVKTNEISIPLIKSKDETGYDISKLFYVTSGDVNFSLTNSSMDCSSAQDYSIDFVNSIIDSVSLSFVFNFKGCSPMNIEIILRDCENSDKEISVKFNITNSAINYVGLQNYEITQNFDNDIKVTLKGNNVDINGTKYLINKDNGNNPFYGFSDKVNLSIKTENTSAYSTVKILRILNQPITTNKKDLIAPIIVCNGALAYYYSLNTVFTVLKALSIDVIDGDLTTFVKVLDSDGNVVRAVSGELLDGFVSADREYQIKLEKFGRYSIIYSSKDSSKKQATYTMSIMVLDVVSPAIDKTDEIDKSAVVNTEVFYPLLGASDNISSELEVNVIFISPSYSFYYPTVNNDNVKFMFTEKGIWTLRYYTFDEVGNIGYSDYEIEVK